jgi:hypothetical protein
MKAVPGTAFSKKRSAVAGSQQVDFRHDLISKGKKVA